MGSRSQTLPSLQAELLLLHPPAVFEFRGRRDIYFPFLSTSGDVPITPLYEYFPVGFRSLQRFLGQRGHEVALLNLSSLLVRYPTLDVDQVFDAFDAPLVGVDLHWMVHVQGALAVVERLKERRPDICTLLGGISATYYASELIQYPYVDLVMTGFDTHEPMERLLTEIRGSRSFERVPNLWWTDGRGVGRSSELVHRPKTFACGIDWSAQPPPPSRKAGLPIRELLTAHGAGCRYDCPWCGGSRSAFQRIFQSQQPLVRKTDDVARAELQSMAEVADIERYHLYAVGSYNETRSGFLRLLDEIGRTGLGSVNIEQFQLPADDLLTRLAEMAPRSIITLSPQSHDARVAALSGRGVYDNEQMEAWIERALELGVHGVDIWYFVGMPEQTESLVMANVDYCAHLLTRFRGQNVNPLICPMVPFLDPGSEIFERPDAFGYQVLCRSAEDHRRAMTRPSFINRLNYQTRWLDREQIVRVGYRAVRELMNAKAAAGMLPSSTVRRYNDRLDDALDFLGVVHEVDCLSDPEERARELDRLGDEIEQRNAKVLFTGVANQAFPYQRQAGGRWFDELGWSPELLDSHTMPSELEPMP